MESQQPSGGEEDPCDTVSPDEAGQCQHDPNTPCPGNLVKNPEIASSGVSGKNGGRFGQTRVDKFGNPKSHDGLDIKSEVGSKLSSMQSGTVSDVRTSFSPGQYKKNSFGNYVQITSTINGKTIVFKYNHLQTVSVEKGDSIESGQIIGKTGITGNAVANGVTPHLHITTWEVAGSEWDLVNPENYISAAFDSNGNLVSSCT